MRVFGYDPVADPVNVLSRIGYLSEENDLPGGCASTSSLATHARSIAAGTMLTRRNCSRCFALDPAAKIKTLSRGQKARAGLLIAVAYRPELLVLDEPSSGLDPIVRRDILGAVIRTIADEGRTVLFSSHLLEEVEQVADHVTMISRGKIALSAPLQAMKESHRCITVRFVESQSQPPNLAGVLRWERVEDSGREWTAVVCDGSGELHNAVTGLDGGASIVAERVPTLDEIFLGHVGTAPAPTRDA